MPLVHLDYIYRTQLEMKLANPQRLLGVSLLTAFALIGSASARDWHVSNRYGNDSNAGWNNSKLKNIATAIGRAKPGDRVLVHNNGWNYGKGSDGFAINLHGGKRNIRVVGASGKPNIRGRVNIQNDNKIENLDISTGGDRNYAVFMNGGWNPSVIRCSVHDCDGGGIGTRYGNNFTINNNSVWNTGKNSGFDKNSAHSGISVYQPTGSKGGYVNVRWNTSNGNKRKRGSFDGNGIIIDDFNNRQSGGRGGWYSGNVTVNGNTTKWNAGYGIRVFDSRASIINRKKYFSWGNTVSNNGDGNNKWADVGGK